MRRISGSAWVYRPAKIAGSREHLSVLKIRPNAPDAHANIRDIALREGNLDEALAAFRKRLSAPPFAGAHFNYFSA